MMRMEGRVADGVYIGAIPPEIIDSAIENIKKGINRREKPNQHIHINSFWGWHIKKDKKGKEEEWSWEETPEVVEALKKLHRPLDIRMAVLYLLAQKIKR